MLVQVVFVSCPHMDVAIPTSEIPACPDCGGLGGIETTCPDCGRIVRGDPGYLDDGDHRIIHLPPAALTFGGH